MRRPWFSRPEISGTSYARATALVSLNPPPARTVQQTTTDPPVLPSAADVCDFD